MVISILRKISKYSLMLFFVFANGIFYSSAHSRQPNIILISADDLGYKCIEANSGNSCKTVLLADKKEPLKYDARINGKEILTPAAVKSPKINGAAVFGVRPGKPIYYHMSVSGVKPMQYAAKGLPQGIKIDPKTGWLTGKAPLEKANYQITLQASNRSGKTERKFTLTVGETICLTPPMGWNSWYVQSEGVSEKAIREMATAMEEKGLDQYGFTYINIDDCWIGKRDPKTKAIQANSKFTDMKAMAQFVNSKGFKLGIYSTTWMSTFAGFIGGTAPNPEGDYSEFFLPESEIINPSQFFGRHPSSHKRGLAKVGPYWFVDRDAKQFAEWGIDYVKYDWTEGPLEKQKNGEYKRNEVGYLKKTDSITKRFYNDFKALDRDIVISLSPSTPVNEDGLTSKYCNLWRLTKDIKSNWEDLKRPFGAEMLDRYKLTKPGLYGDLDMLQIGPLGKPNRAEKVFVPSPLTASEQYFQVTLWCILTQPLLLSCNIPTMDDFDLNLVKNSEVLAVNQDPLVKQGYRIESKEGNYEIWAKDLSDGSKALAFFNLADEEQELSITADKLGKKGKLLDLWRQKDIGEFNSELKVKVNAHGTALFKVY
jgi:alpha-galactosidase